MVYEHTIPFGAPSQLRLMIAPGPEGTAELAVLDQFNNPIGNLRNIKTSLKDLKAVTETDTAVVSAQSDKAACMIRVADDPRHEDLEIHYEDRENNKSKTATVTIEDFKELIDKLLGESG
jgi:hypothetical protein